MFNFMTQNALLPDKDTISVIKHLDLPQEKIFMIDNTSFEEIDFETIIKTIPNYGNAIKKAILTQARCFDMNKQNIEHLLKNCQKFDSFDTSSIEAIYKTNKVLMSSIETFLETKNELLNKIYPQITRLNELFDIATSKLTEYSDYTTTTKFKYQEFETRENEHRTICSKCERNEINSCHNPCKCIKFGQNIIDCCVFELFGYNYHLCFTCGHEAKYHSHSKQFAITKEKIEIKENGERKNLYFQTQNEIRKLQWDIKDVKKSQITSKKILFNCVKSIINLTYDLKLLNPIKLINDKIVEYINQCIKGICNQDTNYNKSNQASAMSSTDLKMKKLKQVEEYKRLLQIYQIRHEFCLFFDKFCNCYNCKNTHDKEWSKHFINNFVTQLNCNSTSNGIEDIKYHAFYCFSKTYFDSFMCVVKNQQTQRDKWSIEWINKWIQFWNMHYKRFMIVYNLISNCIMELEYTNKSQNTNKKCCSTLFDCDVFIKTLTALIELARNKLAREYENVGKDVLKMYLYIVKSIKVEWRK